MSVDRRMRNSNWLLNPKDNGSVPTPEAQLAVLMDIREELKSLNGKLDCYRVRAALDAITKMHKNGVKLRRARKRP